MTWIEIKTQDDIENLLTIFGDFHDACLKEMHLWTDTYVQPNLSMSIGPGWDYHAHFLFQRQWANPSAIEIGFDEIRNIYVVPSPPNYDNSIFGATLLLEEGIFYWAETSNWRPDGTDCNDFTWIAASRMKWRDASDWMSETLRYGSHQH